MNKNKGAIKSNVITNPNLLNVRMRQISYDLFD